MIHAKMKVQKRSVKMMSQFCQQFLMRLIMRLIMPTIMKHKVFETPELQFVASYKESAVFADVSDDSH